MFPKSFGDNKQQMSSWLMNSQMEYDVQESHDYPAISELAYFQRVDKQKKISCKL